LDKALCTHSTVTRGEVIVSPIKKEAAVGVRDAFVKGIYDRTFIWIVMKINKAIFAGEQDKIKKNISIGVLDIFGFDNYPTNRYFLDARYCTSFIQFYSFEQMCINYCSESMQQFFVRRIFKVEQVEYEKQKIKWQHIAFKDNQEILNMIAVNPQNIFALINEESTLPNV